MTPEVGWDNELVTEDRYIFLELDDVTRSLMLEEMELDLTTHGHLYVGKTLTQRGSVDYPRLMRLAIADHDEAWLTDRINEEERVSPLPVDAARRLARTEFNRYYIRGICRRAGHHRCTTVIPYRAHESRKERRDSPLLENEPQAAPRILANLRGKAMQGDPESGLGRVNSGLSARCGCGDCGRALR